MSLGNNGKIILKENYDSLLKAVMMDHVKFQDLEKGLKGEVIIDKLNNDFHVLNHFHLIKLTLPPISYVSCVELELLSREMMDYEIPSIMFWK